MNDEVNNEAELKGYLSISFCKDKTFNDFCENNFNNFNRNQFEAIAIKVFYGKEITMTLYALDKFRQEKTTEHPVKLPVKKFKVNLPSFDSILPFIKDFNFTLTTGDYPLEDMEVINK